MLACSILSSEGSIPGTRCAGVKADYVTCDTTRTQTSQVSDKYTQQSAITAQPQAGYVRREWTALYLLHLREVVVGVAVQHQPTNVNQREVRVRPHLVDTVTIHRHAR